MNKYSIEEVQGMNASREPRKITAKSLDHAKTNATRGQAFKGTWLHIYDSDMNHIARKNPHNKKWEDTPQ